MQKVGTSVVSSGNTVRMVVIVGAGGAQFEFQKRSPLQPLAATCSHLLPSSGCPKWVQVAASGCKWLPEQVAASIRNNLEKKSTFDKTAFFSSWQVAASGCCFENQNDARMLAL